MTETLSQVAGRNARRLRLAAEVTLEDCGVAARRYGLPWSSGRVGDFEAGRVAASLSTLYAVALMLRDATLAHEIHLWELFDGEGDVAINDSLTVSLASVRSALKGTQVSEDLDTDGAIIILGFRGERLYDGPAPEPEARESDVRLAMRVAKDFGLEDHRFVFDLMSELWKRPLSYERDARAGAKANAQRKGQISRELLGELTRHIEILEAEKPT